MKPEHVPARIPHGERARLLGLARRAIHSYVLDQNIPDSDECPIPGERRGAFVTLHLARRLRGCIGRLDSLDPLDTLVAVCAVLAASRDPRFPPVQRHELDALEIEISLLTPPEAVTAAEALARFEVGVHGLAVTLDISRGLLLPQVAAEQGWNALRFLQETCRKAGLPPDAWRDPETRIELFTAEVFSEAQHPADSPAAADLKSTPHK